MIRALLPLAFAAAAAWPGAGAASTGDSDYSTKETRALMHAYARCVVRQQPIRAAEAIVANVDNATILRRYPMLLSGTCLGNAARDDVSMRFTGDLYRYALADALVNRDLAKWPASDLAGIPQLVHRDPGPPPPQVTASGKPVAQRKYRAALDNFERDSVYAYLSRYGECIVRSNPGGSKALLLTGPDTPEENSAFATLRPVLASCLTQGRTLRFGRVTLRGTIAINFYRLAHAARATATGTSS